jgi:hypothetical protein
MMGALEKNRALLGIVRLILTLDRTSPWPSDQPNFSRAMKAVRMVADCSMQGINASTNLTLP